jgi:glycosyltransferase involved in cell wall biosynthesis
MKPRVLFVGRNRIRLPLDPTESRKWGALGDALDMRVLASAPAGAPTRNGAFELVPPLRPTPLDGAAFYLALPFRVARALRRFRPEAVVTQSAYEAAAVLVGRALAGSNARVIVDVHGDWRTSTRLYGSPLRRLAAPAGDALTRAALRRADAVRTISDYTTGLVRSFGVEPADVFPAFMDLDPFLVPPLPLPERPSALFVGVLELYKNVDGLAQAWRLAVPRVPDAVLHLVGMGSRADVVEALLADLPGQTRWTPWLPAEGVARALDEATCLVLPSRSEGMGRVIVEALLRGRPVVGSDVGGIRDLVRAGDNGLLVPPGSAARLADTLVAVLSDRALAERLAARARASAEPWLATPQQYAERMRALVERVARA